MHIVIVTVDVKADRTRDFLAATRTNVRQTLEEPGVRRFDLLQEKAEPARFVLVEVYRTPEDHAHHKETPHYRRWAEEVEPWLSAPRSRVIYESCFPQESGWE